MWGVSMYGGATWAGVYALQYAAITTAVDFFNTRISQPVQSSPWLQFFRIEASAGTVIRVVDFADKDASASAGKVDFNGETYDTIRVGRTQIEESLDGKLPSINLTILDPTRAYTDFVKDQSGLTDAKVTYWLTTFDKLTEPTLARKMVFSVRNAWMPAGPGAVVIQLGPPNTLDQSFPFIPVNRWRCHNDYPRRYVHDGFNFCDYPSDEFELVTQQAIKRNGAAAETAQLHGWFSLNLDGVDTFYRAGLFRTGFTKDRSMQIQPKGTDIRWKDAVQQGLFLYKKIGVDQTDEDQEVDFYAKIGPGGSLKVDNMIGLLVQSIADPTDSIFWGLWEQTIGGGFKHRVRVTASDVSTDTDIADTTERVHRIERSGSTWKVYTAAETLDERSFDALTWTERSSKTLTVDDTQGLLCGFLCASDSTAANAKVDGDFFYARYLAGGFDKCNRSFADCGLRNNLQKFNAFLGLPDSIIRSIS
jgi:phage-related protein